MESIPMSTYVFCSMLLYFLAGISFFEFDRKWGRKIYIKRYNLTHENKISPEDERGLFVFRRKTRVQVFWAGIVAFATSIMCFMWFGTNPVIEIMSWFLDMPMTLAGVKMGPLFAKFWSGRDEVFDKIDDFEKSARDGTLVKDIREGLGGIRDEITGDVSTIFGRSDEAVQKEEPLKNPIEDDEPTEEELRKMMGTMDRNRRGPHHDRR